MKDMEVTYSHTYSTRFIVDGDLQYSRMGEMGLERYDRLFCVIDENIIKLYRDIIIGQIGTDSEKTFIIPVRAEEYSKSIDFYPKLVEFLEAHNAGRYDAVVAVGGGIVIDLVGFMVSTYMRGLPFFVIATTLIGQTDASTAGKTCLNSKGAKNLLGTFYYPRIVYNGVGMLKTCPKRITRQGLSEAFKYGLLTNEEILEDIISFSNRDFDIDMMERIVRKTIGARVQVRNVDPLASNLGHTFGHALEKYLNYEVLHGDAILTGTVMAINYGTEKGLMEKAEKEKIFGLMQRAGLNVYIPFDLNPHILTEFMRKDKKSSSKKLHLVMINGIGRPYRAETPFYEADYADVEEFLDRYVKEYPYKKEHYTDYLRNEILD